MLYKEISTVCSESI